MTYRRIFKYLVILIALLIISSAAQARPVVLSKGGLNDWPVCRSGDGLGEYNMFRFIGPGIHESLIIFDDQGNSSVLPYTYFSPLQHTHTVSSWTDFDAFVWPTAIAADHSKKALKAAHTQTADNATHALRADASPHGANGKLADSATYSVDGYPKAAGKGESTVWAGNAWTLAATVPVTTIPNGLYFYDDKGNVNLWSYSEFAKKYSTEYKNYTNWTVALAFVGGVISMFGLIGAICHLVMRWTKFGDYNQSWVTSILILFILALPVATRAGMPEEAGKDGYIVSGKDGTLNYKFLNDPADPSKISVILGYSATGETDFTKIDSVAKNPHQHLMSALLEKENYKYVSVKEAETATQAISAEDATTATECTHCVTAVEAANCAHAVHAKASLKSGNGLPVTGLQVNDTMARDKEKIIWINRPAQIPFGFKRNSFLGTDKTKAWVGYSKDAIVKEIDDLANKLDVRNWWFLGLTVVISILGVYTFYGMIVRFAGFNQGDVTLKIDGKSKRYWQTNIDNEHFVHVGHWQDWSNTPRKYFGLFSMVILVCLIVSNLIF